MSFRPAMQKEIGLKGDRSIKEMKRMSESFDLKAELRKLNKLTENYGNRKRVRDELAKLTPSQREQIFQAWEAGAKEKVEMMKDRFVVAKVPKEPRRIPRLHLKEVGDKCGPDCGFFFPWELSIGGKVADEGDGLCSLGGQDAHWVSKDGKNETTGRPVVRGAPCWAALRFLKEGIKVTPKKEQNALKKGPQRTILDLMKSCKHNELNGSKVVSDLRAHPELWLGVVPERMNLLLRDLRFGMFHFDRIQILCPKENAHAIRELAAKWRYDGFSPGPDLLCTGGDLCNIDIWWD